MWIEVGLTFCWYLIKDTNLKLLMCYSMVTTANRRKEEWEEEEGKAINQKNKDFAKSFLHRTFPGEPNVGFAAVASFPLSLTLFVSKFQRGRSQST